MSAPYDGASARLGRPSPSNPSLPTKLLGVLCAGSEVCDNEQNPKLHSLVTD